MFYSKLHIFLVYLFLLGLFSGSCKKEEEHPVPNVQVYFNINLRTDPEFFRLLTVGNSMIIENTTIGVGYLGYSNSGVIVYNNGDNEFFAFDRTCPHDMPSVVIVDSDGTSGVADCPECGSKYVFASVGAPTTSSVSKWPLKAYNASYNPNTGDLRVTY